MNRIGHRLGEPAEKVQEVTGDVVEVAFVDQGYTGERAVEEAAAHGIQLEGVKLAEAKKVFVLLPRRWVVERSLGWAARFRRLARDYKRLPETLSWTAFSGICDFDGKAICYCHDLEFITDSCWFS